MPVGRPRSRHLWFGLLLVYFGSSSAYTTWQYVHSGLKGATWEEFRLSFIGSVALAGLGLVFMVRGVMALRRGSADDEAPDDG